MAYDEALAQRIRGLLNGPTVEERKMFGGLAFLVGGRMCCGVQDTDLMVRIPKDGHEHTLLQPHVRPMDFTGRPLTGFIYVGPAGTKSAAALRKWITLGQQAAALAPAPRRSARRRP